MTNKVVRMTEKELAEFAFYTGEAICNPDPKYWLEYKKKAHPGAVLALITELQERRKVVMNSEPVYQCEFTHADATGELHQHWEDVSKAFYDHHRGQRRILYAVPQPAPVPVEMTVDLALSNFGISGEYCEPWSMGWNARGAAMLQSVDSPVNSGSRPDQTGSEPVYQYRIRNLYNNQVTEWQTIKRGEVDFVLKAQPHNAEFRIITNPQALPVEMRNNLKAEALEELLEDASQYAPLSSAQWQVLVKNWHQKFIGLSGKSDASSAAMPEDITRSSGVPDIVGGIKENPR